MARPKGVKVRENVKLPLDEHDKAIVATVQEAMANAIAKAHNPVAVSKRITALAVRNRNLGRKEAIKKYPFKGICEASGLPLDREHACLDEVEPWLGYKGKLRWVCPKANNSGKYSCGRC
jgi:hypothetical protein